MIQSSSNKIPYSIGDKILNINTNIEYEILSIQSAGNEFTNVAFFLIASNDESFWIREGLLYSKYVPSSKVMRVLYGSNTEVAKLPKPSSSE